MPDVRVRLMQKQRPAFWSSNFADIVFNSSTRRCQRLSWGANPHVRFSFGVKQHSPLLPGTVSVRVRGAESGDIRSAAGRL